MGGATHSHWLVSLPNFNISGDAVQKELQENLSISISDHNAEIKNNFHI